MRPGHLVTTRLRTQPPAVAAAVACPMRVPVAWMVHPALSLWFAWGLLLRVRSVFKPMSLQSLPLCLPHFL